MLMASLKNKWTKETSSPYRLIVLVKLQLSGAISDKGKWLRSEKHGFSFPFFFFFFLLTFHKYVLGDAFFKICALLPEEEGAFDRG